MKFHTPVARESGKGIGDVQLYTFFLHYVGAIEESCYTDLVKDPLKGQGTI
jgi:hypothetical protein